jgi:hypothetical protein
VWICSVNSPRAISVDLAFLAPIWVFGKRLWHSAMSWIRFTIIASISFPIVLSSAIGLHAPSISYDSFPGFRRTTILACRNLCG